MKSYLLGMRLLNKDNSIVTPVHLLVQVVVLAPGTSLRAGDLGWTVSVSECKMVMKFQARCSCCWPFGRAIPLTSASAASRDWRG